MKTEKELKDERHERIAQALERIANTLDYLAYMILKESGAELQDGKKGQK